MPTASAQRTTGQSLREYGSRLARAAGAAGGELALAGAGSGAVARAGRAAGYVGRRGLIGTAAAPPAGPLPRRRAGGWSGVRSLAPGCRRGPHGARRHRQLAGNASASPARSDPRRAPRPRRRRSPTRPARTRAAAALCDRRPRPQRCRCGGLAAQELKLGRESALRAQRQLREPARRIRRIGPSVAVRGASSSSARPTSRQPAPRPPAAAAHRSTPRAPAPKPARKPFAARRPRPFRTRKPPKGDAR